MTITKKDWIFIAFVVAVVATFVAISGKEKTKLVPFDANHQEFYAKVAGSGLSGMKEADLACPRCHNDQGGVPFPPKHPVKPAAGPMSCHLCHKYDKAHVAK